MKLSIHLIIHLIFVVLIGLQQIGTAQDYAGNHALLKAKVTNLPVNKVYLQQILGYRETIVDSSTVSADGEFSFNQISDENQNKPLSKGLYRVILGQTKRAIYYNEPPQSFSFINAGEYVLLQTQFESPVDSMKVLCGDENRLYYEYLNHRKASNAKLQLLDNLLQNYPDDCNSQMQHRKRKSGCFLGDIQRQFNDEQLAFISYINRLIKTHPNLLVSKIARVDLHPFMDASEPKDVRLTTMRNQFFKASDFNDTLILHTDVLNTKIISYLGLFRDTDYSEKEQTTSFIHATDQLLKLAKKGEQQVYSFVVKYLSEGFNQIKQEGVLAYLSEKYLNVNSCFADDTKLNEIITNTAKLKQTQPGVIAPEIVFASGKTMNQSRNASTQGSASLEQQHAYSKLSDLKSNYTLVFFWASWCPHCTESISKLKSFYTNVNKKSSDFLEILAVSLDTDTLQWTNIIEKNQLTWINYCEFKKWKSNAAEAYNIRATPTYFLLDSNKKIIAESENIEQINDLITKNQ